jgi:hypothetical protein
MYVYPFFDLSTLIPIPGWMDEEGDAGRTLDEYNKFIALDGAKLRNKLLVVKSILPKHLSEKFTAVKTGESTLKYKMRFRIESEEKYLVPAMNLILDDSLTYSRVKCPREYSIDKKECTYYFDDKNDMDNWVKYFVELERLREMYRED